MASNIKVIHFFLKLGHQSMYLHPRRRNLTSRSLKEGKRWRKRKERSNKGRDNKMKEKGLTNG